MDYYSLLTKDERLIEHLHVDEKILYGSSCRDASASMEQSNIGIFAGICFKALKTLDVNDEAIISVWTFEDLSLSCVKNTPNTYNLYENNGWCIKIPKELEVRLLLQRKMNLPNETGSSLVGAYDFERKICYIIDALPTPVDSIATTDSFQRGYADLEVEVNRIETTTRTNVYYIGEWHSHPNNCVQQSNKDKNLHSEIFLKHTEPRGHPACMIVVAETHLGFYIKE